MSGVLRLETRAGKDVLIPQAAIVLVEDAGHEGPGVASQLSTIHVTGNIDYVTVRASLADIERMWQP